MEMSEDDDFDDLPDFDDAFEEDEEGILYEFKKIFSFQFNVFFLFFL